MNPVLHQFRVYGPKNALVVDDDNQTLIKIPGGKYKSYLDQFIPPLAYAKQYLANSAHNIRKFIQADFHMSAGMKFLMESFYHSVSDNAPLPISYREILLTSKIMDEIFKQINK
jgi:hypothetical protein